MKMIMLHFKLDQLNKTMHRFRILVKLQQQQQSIRIWRIHEETKQAKRFGVA